MPHGSAVRKFRLKKPSTLPDLIKIATQVESLALTLEQAIELAMKDE
jgi:hypothetical protein